MQYRLVERRARGSTAGLALNLPGNAVAALHTLGAADEVIAAGVPVARREYRTAGGRLLFAVDEARFWSGSTPSVCARHHVVVDALAAGVSVEHGMAVTSLAHRADAGVAVTFADGQQDRFDFVVAADGVRSTVRSAVAPAAPRPSLMTAASWRFVTSEVGIDCWTAWTGRGRTFLLIPVATGQVYAYASSSRGGDPGTDPTWLGEAFADFPTPVTRAIDQALAAADPPYHSPVEEVRIPTWHHDRAALIGDAAHATGPVWAQGAAMAMEDAIVLADLLAGTEDWSSVGSAWEQARRPRVEHVQAATDRPSRLAGLPPWLTHALAPLMGPRAYRATYRPLRTFPSVSARHGGPGAGGRSRTRRSPRRAPPDG
jgi:2-polyprenyl-6-methoxyphenol hydroxylase-like FAD-dependent oxidoreductase